MPEKCKRYSLLQKLHRKWELRREKSCRSLVPRYATISRDLNVTKRSCKGTEFCRARLAKKSEVRFRKSAGALIKKQCFFQRIVLGTESVLIDPNYVLSEKDIVFLWSFLQQLKATNQSPSRREWYCTVTQFSIATRNETKQTRHHRNMKRF